MVGLDGSGRQSAGDNASRRFFTLTEANRSLVLVRRIATDVVGSYARLIELQETLEAAQQCGKYDLATEAQEQILTIVDRVRGYAAEIEQLGATLQDWMLGIVGFPCMAEGREVTLCWQASDAEVLYWHEVSSSCDQRRPIGTLPVEEVVGAGSH